MKEYFERKKVLVTGGAGFIGSHLSEKLVNLGAKVTICDNFSTGKLENLETIKNDITLIEGNVTDKQICHTASKQQNVIFHCAALVSVPLSMEDPSRCFEDNITGLFNVLESARENKVNKLIFSSSSAVYGPQEESCFEEMAPNPISFYGTSKLVGERLCNSYANYFNVATICLRYFNVYGPRQSHEGPYAGVIAKFREQMRNNKPITIYGDGKQTRDFIPVSEVVRANLLLATLPREHLSGQPVNIASNKTLSLLELYERLKKEFPEYNQKINFMPARDGDIKHSKAMCKRFDSLLQLMI
ncbi:hypothetical protein A3F06_02920 [candidate division TM6 bacterium RIFCSPHIGHO2_12_FULL_36_22]|nr:MAG: hypothetical protein A3F06_02920 [candidate division TM6 bacterium RIFCSPHIGHO2_12_FULL_36_22]